jgi:hypothetical protein
MGDSFLRDSQPYLEPLFYMAACLLAISGVVKLRNPNPAARALVVANVPFAGVAAGRVVGMIEVIVATSAFLAPKPLGAAALGLCYLTFAGFVLFMTRFRPAATSCGCLGSRDVAPNYVHALLDTIGGLIAILTLFGSSRPNAIEWLRSFGFEAPLLVAALSALAYACYGAAAFLVVTLRSSKGIPRPRLHSGRERRQNIDEILMAAGVGPDHPSLHGAIWRDAGGSQMDPTPREIRLIGGGS